MQQSNLSSLFLISESTTNGYSVECLDVLSVIAIIFAMGVILNKNPIASILSLIGLFGTISVYLILSGLTFIGFAYLIVYIGAVSILFLFILMLINIRTSEFESNNTNSLPLALLISILFNYILIKIIPSRLNAGLSFFGARSNGSTIAATIGENTVGPEGSLYVSSNYWDGNLIESSHISTLGGIIYTSYSLWLLLVSLILLVVMIGAILITIKKEC
uniref:NADH-ubiquinone oxidoreductase chain 6 n=1 Tax=Claviceps purpurea TaxID=5111 RepID=I7ICR0_CLAPU|nr:NADH-ubiquinone oxidoreductase chain 6 [Claviceps purpurea]